MIRHLIDLWILREEGNVIFSKSDPLDPDNKLLGRLISALYNFTQNRFSDKLIRFTTNKHQYYIIEQQGILFAGIFPRNKTIKEKYILKELGNIEKKFFERFTKTEVDNWDHDVLGEFIDSLWGRDVEREN